MAATAVASPMQQMTAGEGQLQKDIASTKAAVTRTADEAEATERTAFKGYSANLDDISSQFEKLKKEGEEALKPFEAPKPQDPLKSYGASMAGLMGIVSFFTHGSMVPAMNAATASINALREGNTEAYDRSFNEWKTNTELATKKLTWESEQLHTILELSKDNYDLAVSHAKNLAAITQDRALSVTLDAQGIEGAAKLYDARIKGQEALDKHSAFLLDYGERKLLENSLKGLVQSGALGGDAANQKNLPPPNAGRKVDLKAVAFPMGDLAGIAAPVEGAALGKAYGEAARHVTTKEALDQLREKTLSAFRSSQLGRSLAAQMKSVDDIVPRGGLTTYPTIREAVKQTRENLAGLRNDLLLEAQTSFTGKNRGKLAEDVKAISQISSVLRDYDAILQDNPEPGVEAGQVEHTEPQENQIYVDAKGNKAKKVNGRWVEVP